ncbi:hypothetical protein GCM10009540_70330 [Streptomyces turgidiscabies]
MLTITTDAGGVTRGEDRVTGEVARTAARSRKAIDRRVMLRDPHADGGWIFRDPDSETLLRGVIGSPRSQPVEDLLEQWQNHPAQQGAEIRRWLDRADFRRGPYERSQDPRTRTLFLERLRWSDNRYARYVHHRVEAYPGDPESIDDLHRYLRCDALEASQSRVFAVFDAMHAPRSGNCQDTETSTDYGTTPVQ